MIDRSHRASGRLVRAAVAAVLMALVAGVLSAVAPAASAATGSSCGATINRIVCENSKPGTDPSIWDINGSGDGTIQGYATDISVNAGSRVDFKISTPARAYSVEIYRTGWYQGLGARKVATVAPSATLPQTQPQCRTEVATELYDCGNWSVSASWNVPADAVSGVYFARLIRTDTGGDSHIVFVVRNDGNTSDVLFQTSDPTWQAYNTYGGSDFYQGAANGRAFKVSYNRPVNTRGNDSGRDFYFSSEYATVRFLERNGYDVSYLAGVDTDRRGGELLNHKVFLSVGHDEYWSGAQRANVTAARDAGVNLQFLAGNEGYWRTRYEASSASGTVIPYRTLTSYKETWSNAKIDPSTEWTGTWRDPRFAAAAQGGTSPENQLTGTMYMVNNVDLPVTVSAAEGKNRLWRSTSAASLTAGAKKVLAAHTIGYESNEDIDNGRRPAGLIRLSTTVGPTEQYLTDYGNTVVAGRTTTHHVTLYRAASGALVFSAASIQWGWGLDFEHDGGGAAADVVIQQAEVNLLADMGAQPETRMSTLAAATKSTDTTAPVTAISTPATGASFAHGSVVTVTGTASDTDGVVAGVEVSGDGGTTWHPANGTANWTWSYVQQGGPTSTIVARAIDDSGNFSQAGVSRSVTVTGSASAFGQTVPVLASAKDTGAVELGVKFVPTTDGYVTGVRFYKGSTNTGTHVGTLWNASGGSLASATFTSESATGWQSVQFTNPVAVVAGTTYVASYTAPRGGYAYDVNYWPYAAAASAPVSVPSGVGTASPGVYGSSGQFPRQTFGDANYYVDVSFSRTDNTPLRLTARSPLAGSSSVALGGKVTATFTRAVDTATLQLGLTAASGTTVPGTTTYDAAAKTATFQSAAALSGATTYTVVVDAKDTSGVALETGSGWSFTTQPVDPPAGQCPCTLSSESERPTIDADSDTRGVTLGVRVTPSVSGTVTAIKFFKGSRGTGAHTGALWSPSGTRMATIAFSNESTYGWQTATLSTPIAVTAGQTYTASYYAPAGAYSATAGQYGSSLVRGPLTVPASGGAYVYGDAYPGTTTSTSYLVDLVFTTAAAGPALVSTTPASAAVDVATTTAVSATFGAAIATGYSGTVTADGAAVAGAWTQSADRKTLTFAPAAALPAGASVTAVLTGLAGTDGARAADATWSFTTAPAGGTSTVTLLGTSTPQVASDPGETTSLEVGMAFRTSQGGVVRAIRFYKGSANTGTHVGSLWGPGGERLAQVTFTGETATGWQRAALTTAVRLTPGTVYTVSYLAPRGGISYTSGGLSTAITKGPLSTETTDNGRYRYGTGGTMPASSYAASNYFVDVEFLPDPDTGPAVVSTTPAAGATGVAAGGNVEVVFDRDVATGSPSLTLTGAAAVAGATSYDAAARRLLFDPTSDLAPDTSYTATATVSGTVLQTWSFRTAPASTGTTQTLFGTETPATASAADTAAVEVGTAFTVSTAGSVTAIRFYKGSANTGTHVGTLWSSSGAVLGRVTFTNETATGWQRAVLATPVQVVPGQTYTVSYTAPRGGYAVTARYFTTAKTSGPITAPTTNGRYRYGTGGTAPSSTYQSSSYFVDVEIVFS